MDFRSPSVSDIADFLLHLFKDKSLQPSTIDGYRTAIADMVGNEKLNISKNENLTCLLDSFHRDQPKGRQGVPSWNLSLVLHQLTKAPFETMRKASLKHLTFKTVFLLALGSGKRRSEIHAWLYKNIRHQKNWSQVSLPFTQFSLKGPTSEGWPGFCSSCGHSSLGSFRQVSNGGQIALPGKSLAILSGQDQGSLSGLKDLVFVSFRKSFQDIVPATISSWIKQSFYVTNCQMRKLILCIRLELMMSGPLQPPRRSKAGSP